MFLVAAASGAKSSEFAVLLSQSGFFFVLAASERLCRRLGYGAARSALLMGFVGTLGAALVYLQGHYLAGLWSAGPGEGLLRVSSLGVSENGLLACGIGAVLGAWVGLLSAPALRERLVFLTAAVPSAIVLLMLAWFGLAGGIPQVVAALAVILALLLLLGGTVSLSFLGLDAFEAAQFPAGEDG